MCPQDEPEEVNDRQTMPSGALQRFEAELASLSPRAVRLDRDRLMYLAGQASATSNIVEPLGRGWGWPTAFSAMTALAASLLVIIVARPQTRVVERIVQVPVEVVKSGELDANGDTERDNAPLPTNVDSLLVEQEANSSGERIASGHSYVDLRDRVLAMGLEDWRDDTAGGGGRTSSPTAYHDLLDSLLHGG